MNGRKIIHQNQFKIATENFLIKNLACSKNMTTFDTNQNHDIAVRPHFFKGRRKMPNILFIIKFNEQLEQKKKKIDSKN